MPQSPPRSTPVPGALLPFLIGGAIFLGGSALRLAVLTFMARANGETLDYHLGRWDARHYMGIAEHGYFSPLLPVAPPVHETSLAFFPGLPGLIRLLVELTPLGFSQAAALISVVSGVFLAAGAMVLAARLGARVSGQIAVAVLVTCAPMSITFSMAYTEALFGALALWTLVALVDRRWWLAAALIFLCGFVRITVVALLAAFAVALWFRASRSLGAWMALLASSCSLLGYVSWASWHTRDSGGYFGIQAAGWHSGFDFGQATARWVWMVLTTSQEGGYLLSVGVMIAAVLALFFTYRRLPAPLYTFAATVCASVLLSDGIMHSRPRLLLPAVIVLAPFVIRFVQRVPVRYSLALGSCWVLFGAWFSGYMLTVFPWAI